MSNSRARSFASLAFLLCGTAAFAQEPATPAPNASAPQASTPDTGTPDNSTPDSSTVGAPAPSNASPEVRAVAHTGVRIVRLSEVTGVVQLDRGNRAFEPAFANLPIVQGARLRTEEGTAEVEFEDGSSVRLTPHSLVEFPTLSANSDGTRLSTVRLTQGSVYASVMKGKPSNITLAFQDQSLALGPAAHIVLTASPGTPRLDVLDGTVQATQGSTTQLVTHKKALVFDPVTDSATLVSSKREESPFDSWDKRSVEYHNNLAARSQLSNTSYQYGMADLNYYGSFLGGSCAGMWRPYLVSSSWSPYGYGAWALYPGAGYSWVSPYPWGWAPYHSGTWGFCPGTGYAWSPGGDWYGLNNTPLAIASGRLPLGVQPIRAPRPPLPVGGKPVVLVSEQPLVASGANEKSDKFLFRANSAGLGVPRGVFGKLNGISNNALQHGSAARDMHVEIPAAHAGAQVRGAGQGQVGIISRGSAPSSSHSSQAAFGSSTGLGSHSGPSGISGGGSHAGGISGGGASSGGHH